MGVPSAQVSKAQSAVESRETTLPSLHRKTSPLQAGHGRNKHPLSGSRSTAAPLAHRSMSVLQDVAPVIGSTTIGDEDSGRQGSNWQSLAALRVTLFPSGQLFTPPAHGDTRSHLRLTVQTALYLLQLFPHSALWQIEPRLVGSTSPMIISIRLRGESGWVLGPFQ